MTRILFHLDMDAFYASVEVRDNPSLKGLPLVVGADPQNGRGRGVVCTASYEARAFGIRSAMPISEAWRRAPHATYIRPDFRKYGPASHAVMEVLERYADILEVVGMDEAYLDVTERCHADPEVPPWEAALNLARSLQAAVKRVTGLSCSIGVASSKSVAKVASDRRKPHGITRVRPEEVAAFLEPLAPAKLNGCGPKTASALRELGVTTIGDLARLGEAALTAQFGSHGAWLHHVANGRDDRPVVADHGARKSRGNETTFGRDQRDAGRILATAHGLLDEILTDQGERDGRAFSTLTVKLRYGDFTTLTRAFTIPAPLKAGQDASADLARRVVADLLGPLLDGRSVRLVGVRLSGFQEATGQQALTAYGFAGLARARLHVAGLARARVASGAFNPGGLRWTTLGSWTGSAGSVAS